MVYIDLNADIGESYGAFSVGNDTELMQVISSANIACGFHAGDYNTIPATIDLAKAHRVGVGAHPGYQDILGFGRRMMTLSPEEIYHQVVYQIGAIQAFCKVKNVPLVHVKPHGELYNLASRDEEAAEAIAQAVYDIDPKLVLFGICNGALIESGRKVGLSVAAEAFADRSYSDNGLLTPRNQVGAVHTDVEVMKRQVIEIVRDHHVTTHTGEKIELKADTICFHGDSQTAYEQAKEIKRALVAEGIEIRNIGDHV